MKNKSFASAPETGEENKNNERKMSERKSNIVLRSFLFLFTGEKIKDGSGIGFGIESK